jgi:hypothetical protein
MEHRWGERFTLNIPVQVDCGPRGTVLGVLRDASASGAFLCTAAQIPLWTSVRVDFVGVHAFSVEAQVVRRAADGFGLEWSDLAPRSVVELTHAPRITHPTVLSGSETTVRPVSATEAVAPPPSGVSPATEETAAGRGSH